MKELIIKALEARNRAYSPYSGFCVGAAVLCDDGSIYTGVNIENASYGATICAERNAIFTAIGEGQRKITAIAIAGGNKDETTPSVYSYPCGICRQVMSEFGGKDMKVFVARSVDDYKEFTLDELLPHNFELEDTK